MESFGDGYSIRPSLGGRGLGGRAHQARVKLEQEKNTAGKTRHVSVTTMHIDN